MNRKTARGLLAVALVCAAALVSAETEVEFTGWVCFIDLPPFSQTVTGDERTASQSKLECEEEDESEAEIECRVTLDRATLTGLGIRRNQTKTFRNVPCRIDARRCDIVGLGIEQVLGKLTINGKNGKTTLTCEKEG